MLQLGLSFLLQHSLGLDPAVDSLRGLLHNHHKHWEARDRKERLNEGVFTWVGRGLYRVDTSSSS